MVAVVPDCVTVSLSPVVAVTPAGSVRVIVQLLTEAVPVFETVYVPVVPLMLSAAVKEPSAAAGGATAARPPKASAIAASRVRGRAGVRLIGGGLRTALCGGCGLDHKPKVTSRSPRV